MKKILIIFILSIGFMLPSLTVQASETGLHYSNGLFDMENVFIHDLPPALIDNDLSTSYRFNREEFVVSHAEGIDISHYFYQGTPNNIIFYFYDKEGSLILEENRTDDVTPGDYKRIDIENVKKIIVEYTSVASVYEIEFFSETFQEPIDTTPPGEITNLDFWVTENSVTFDYSMPTDNDFSHLVITMNGEVIRDNYKTETLEIKDLEPDTAYTFKFISVDETGNFSEGVERVVQTVAPPPPPEKPEDLPEIRDLKIEADPERVDLSWKNPPQFFEKAKIYRKVTGATTASVLSNLNPFAPIELQASGDFEPLFETNGTTFADLSIEPEESYEYKVTNFYNGMESNGVTVQTSIPKPPLVDTSNLELPFGVGTLIESGNGLIALIGGFVLLALAFIFVPKVIALIKQSFTGGASRNSNGGTVATGARLTERQQKLVTTGGRQPREPRQGRG